MGSNSQMKLLLIAITALFSLGYKTYPGGNSWSINSSDPKIFLQFCQNLTSSSNDVGPGDALYGQALTHNNIVSSIVNDFNAVTSSFVRIADSATDGTFNATTHAQRIITVCGGTTGTFDGVAQQRVSGGRVVGCAITLGSMSFGAKKMVRTLTHEIGHCLGLDHPQESGEAIMSYFSDPSSIYRLRDDDKAGLTYLYPANASYQRSATFGAACATN